MNSGEISLYHLLLHFHETHEESFCLDKQGLGLLPRQEEHDSKKSSHHSSNGVVFLFSFFLLATRKADRHIRSGAY